MKDQNRTDMPLIASLVDEFRALFGDDLRVTYASENGITKGKPSEPGCTEFILLNETVAKHAKVKK